MKQDRFLLVILGVIGGLVVFAVVLFFIRKEPQTYGSDEIPEGVVRNYVLALQMEDYERAYAYLLEDEDKPTYDDFMQGFLRTKGELDRTAVQLGGVEISADQARVDLTIIHISNDPFDRTWDQAGTALLTLADGQWRIVSMPYPYWGWNWYPPERQ
jgi:hypothetical protein